MNSVLDKKNLKEKKKPYVLRSVFAFLLSAVSFLYFLVILFWGGAHTSILWIWPCASVFCALLGVYLLFFGRINIREPLVYAACLLVFVLLFSFVVFEGFLIGYSFSRAPEGVEYIILLGAAVRDDKPSAALLHRIEAAGEYLRENENCKAVLSGGMGYGESITEAECMRRELVAMGIDESRLILEQRSTTTSENIEYSFELIPDECESVAVVTNNFHVFRAVKLTQKATDARVYGISADFDMPLLVHFAVREYFGYFSDYFLGVI